MRVAKLRMPPSIYGDIDPMLLPMPREVAWIDVPFLTKDLPIISYVPILRSSLATLFSEEAYIEAANKLMCNANREVGGFIIVNESTLVAFPRTP